MPDEEVLLHACHLIRRAIQKARCTEIEDAEHPPEVLCSVFDALYESGLYHYGAELQLMCDLLRVGR